MLAGKLATQVQRCVWIFVQSRHVAEKCGGRLALVGSGDGPQDFGKGLCTHGTTLHNLDTT